MSSNRPIKFRVWDANAKTYLENEVMWSMAAKMPEEVMGSACPWVPFMMIALHSPADKYVVEQFTGLLDKNDKEIYEGDIVKLSLVDERKNSDLEEGKTVGVVRWLDKATCYSLSHPEMPGFRHDLYLADERTPRGDGEFNHTYTIAPWRFEVIGNVHEHAERIPSIQSLIKKL